MTGLHTGHAFIRGNDRIPLRPSDRTIAELLKQAHYSTGIIGKWGLGEPDTTGIPNRKGFDYWFGYLNQRHAHNYYPEYLWQNQERFPLKNIVRPVNPPGGVAIERIEYSHDLFTRRALQFIDENKANLFFPPERSALRGWKKIFEPPIRPSPVQRLRICGPVP